MNAPILTFFNNKGGVGKTSLLYHLAWMYSDLGKKVVAMDLDPQANLTAAFLDEDTIEGIWEEKKEPVTIYHCLKPLTDMGDILPPKLHTIASELLHLLPGNARLSEFEETFSDEWPNSMRDKNLYRPTRILSSFWQVAQMACSQVQADILLMDIGPHMGAINRSAIIATDYVVIPLGADLFSLQGLRNLGPTLRNWKNLWQKRLDNWQDEADSHPDVRLPKGNTQPIGYLCQQHGVKLKRPVQAYDKWVNRIPNAYREFIKEEPSNSDLKPEEDPYCLAMIKHFRSLVPMAQERRKPIFHLTAADGAIGSHAGAVQDAKADFRDLALKIAQKIGMQI